MNLLDFIFPKKCLECGENGKYICKDCLGKVLPYGKNGTNYSLFKYEGIIRKAIISLKYKFAYDVASELAEICIQKLNNNKFFPTHYTLIPVPLFWRRQNWRGFNQAEIIGEKIAHKMGWKFIPDLLIRNKNTTQQVGQKRSDRLKNLSNVFSVRVPNSLSLSHVSVLLFDDVLTTGTTIKEATKALENAGFNNVQSLTIARG